MLFYFWLCSFFFFFFFQAEDGIRDPLVTGVQTCALPISSRLLTVAVSRGRFNDLIAQVRFSSEYLWSQVWCGDALTKVHSFLMSIFGEIGRASCRERV